MIRGSSDASGRTRAQTVQDFAVGIGIFLLAVAFVFSFVPTIITPFEDTGSADTAQADRIAATIVENASTDTPNELDRPALDSRYQGDSDALTEELGLRVNNDGGAITHVNITLVEIEDVDEEEPAPVFTGGDTYDDQVGASATRIVTTTGGDCERACELIVRVW